METEIRNRLSFKHSPFSETEIREILSFILSSENRLLSVGEWDRLRSSAEGLIPSRNDPSFPEYRILYLNIVALGIRELQKLMDEENQDTYRCKDWLAKLEIEFTPVSVIHTRLCKSQDECFLRESWTMLNILRNIAVKLKAGATLARIERDLAPHREHRVGTICFTDRTQRLR